MILYGLIVDETPTDWHFRFATRIDSQAPALGDCLAVPKDECRILSAREGLDRVELSDDTLRRLLPRLPATMDCAVF